LTVYFGDAREYDSGDVTDFMKEEKKRKQMEAIAEDLFKTEKVSNFIIIQYQNIKIILRFSLH